MEEAERVAAEKKVAEIWAAQDIEDLRFILQSAAGRRHLWKLLELCGVYADTHRGENTHDAAHASGRRSIGLSLLENLFTANPNAYTLMRVEAADRARAKRFAVETLNER